MPGQHNAGRERSDDNGPAQDYASNVKPKKKITNGELRVWWNGMDNAAKRLTLYGPDVYEEVPNYDDLDPVQQDTVGDRYSRFMFHAKQGPIHQVLKELFYESTWDASTIEHRQQLLDKSGTSADFYRSKWADLPKYVRSMVQHNLTKGEGSIVATTTPGADNPVYGERRRKKITKELRSIHGIQGINKEVGQCANCRCLIKDITAGRCPGCAAVFGDVISVIKSTIPLSLIHI